VSADEVPWVLQLYALEHKDGRHVIHLTKELIGDATEGVLSVVLPITPAGAVAEFERKNEGARLFDRGFDFGVVVKTFAAYLLDDTGRLSWNVEHGFSTGLRSSSGSSPTWRSRARSSPK